MELPRLSLDFGTREGRLTWIGGVGLLLAVVLAIWAFSGSGGDDKPPVAISSIVDAERKKDDAALSAAVADPNPDTARAAIRALSRVSGPAAIPRVQKALSDPRATVRYQAALQLGLFGAGAQQSLPAVRDAAKDSDASVRAAAAWSLGRLESAESVEPLVQGLDDPDPSVRRASIKSLQDLMRIEYTSYNPDAGQGERQRAIAEIRSYLPRQIKAYNLWRQKLAEQPGGAPPDPHAPPPPRAEAR